MTKLIKYIEYVQTLVYKKYYERKIKYKQTTLKYIFHKSPKSKTLIVVFSACTRVGIPARYNYMRTLNDVKCNKLFILDDFGEDHRGGYYLGRYPDFEYEQATLFLLRQVIEDNQIEKCYFVGSSKGAYAALNFGLQLNIDTIGRGIIIGAPQYFLGKYLSAPANRATLMSMLGSDADNEDVINMLNDRLKSLFESNFNGYKQPIYLHYSQNEHTYIDHIKDMIIDLKNEGYNLHEDVGNYTNHWDVSIYYPKYLLKILQNNEPEIF